MSIGEISFITGIILLFIGILGGGIEIKELKIPQITGAPRYACFVGSILLLILGLYLKHEIPAIVITSPSTPNVSNTSAPAVVTIPIDTSTQAIRSTPADNNAAELAKQQAFLKLNDANKRINAVWNATTQDIRDDLLPKQNQWLKQREEDCSLQASSEQPLNKVMQDTVKLNCMALLTEPRIEQLKQEITEIEQSVVLDELETKATAVDTQTSKRQALIKLDEANKRINAVWNGTTKEIREALLPEQMQWLKEREEDCLLKATNEQPVDKAMQETFKLNCMATMTEPRIEELKEKIAALTK